MLQALLARGGNCSQGQGISSFFKHLNPPEFPIEWVPGYLPTLKWVRRDIEH